MHCIDYIGYKNRSTYLSYTAGFLQAQELSEALKLLKMDFPGFQDSGHADTHTHTDNGHCLKIRVQCQGTGALGGRTRLGCFELLGGRTRWGCFASKDISQTLMMSTVLYGSCLVNFWPFSHGTCPATILSWKNHFSGSNILIFSYQRGRMDQSKALCPVADHPLTCFGAWLQAEDFVDTIWVSSHV